MEKKKKKKKKLGALLLLLFLTVVMLATSTYAWFTANKNVTINDINVKVEASGGIQISTDAVNWKTVIDDTDIKAGYTYSITGTNYTDFNQFPTTLAPVSTAGLIRRVDSNGDGTLDTDTGYLDMYDGVVDANDAGVFALTASQLTEARGISGKYIAFDIFLKTDAATALYIKPGSGAVSTSGKADVGLQNAARIALVVEGTAAMDAEVSSILDMHNATNSNVTIFELNNDAHTSTGVIQSNTYYANYTNYNRISNGIGNPVVSYDGVKAAITDPIVLAETNKTDNADYFATVNPVGFSSAFSAASAGQTNYTYNASFPAGITKVRVYMWIEGQDVDCENNASGAFLTYKLLFTIDNNA